MVGAQGFWHIFPQTAPMRNFQWKSVLVISSDGVTSRKLGNFSTPLVVPLPLILGSDRLWRRDTVRPEPVASSNVLPFGLPLPIASCSASLMTEVMRRKRSNASS